MPAEPRLIDAPEILWRVERATTPLRFSAGLSARGFPAL
jgi:hypothetical protein